MYSHPPLNISFGVSSISQLEMETSYNKIKTITSEEFSSLTPNVSSSEKKEVPPAPPLITEDEDHPSLPRVGKFYSFSRVVVVDSYFSP